MVLEGLAGCVACRVRERKTYRQNINNDTKPIPKSKKNQCRTYARKTMANLEKMDAIIMGATNQLNNNFQRGRTIDANKQMEKGGNQDRWCERRVPRKTT